MIPRQAVYYVAEFDAATWKELAAKNPSNAKRILERRSTDDSATIVIQSLDKTRMWIFRDGNWRFYREEDERNAAS